MVAAVRGIVVSFSAFRRSLCKGHASYSSLPTNLCRALSSAVLCGAFGFFIVLAAGLLAHYYRFGSLDMAGRYNNATVLTGIVVVFCLGMGGVYGSQRGYAFYDNLVYCWRDGLRQQELCFR